MLILMYKPGTRKRQLQLTTCNYSNVSLTMLSVFQLVLNQYFHRKNCKGDKQVDEAIQRHKGRGRIQEKERERKEERKEERREGGEPR